jgi:hypothetical protein
MTEMEMPAAKASILVAKDNARSCFIDMLEGDTGHSQLFLREVYIILAPMKKRMVKARYSPAEETLLLKDEAMKKPITGMKA